jgi:hypothetical protein
MWDMEPHSFHEPHELPDDFVNMSFDDLPVDESSDDSDGGLKCIHKLFTKKGVKWLEFEWESGNRESTLLSNAKEDWPEEVEAFMKEQQAKKQKKQSKKTSKAKKQQETSNKEQLKAVHHNKSTGRQQDQDPNKQQDCNTEKQQQGGDGNQKELQNGNTDKQQQQDCGDTKNQELQDGNTDKQQQQNCGDAKKQRCRSSTRKKGIQEDKSNTTGLCNLDHGEAANYKTECDPGYCRKGLYLGGMSCSDCGAKFIDKGQSVPGETFKPSISKGGVAVCINCDKMGCIRCLCHPCFVKMISVPI